jgi:hypothetical protein
MIRLGHYFDFRFPAPLPNYSIIRFQKGLDSAPGNDGRQASPAFLVRIQQSPSSFRLIPKLPKRPRIHTTTFKLGRLHFIRQYKARPKL